MKTPAKVMKIPKQQEEEERERLASRQAGGNAQCTQRACVVAVAEVEECVWFKNKVGIALQSRCATWVLHSGDYS